MPAYPRITSLEGGCPPAEQITTYSGRKHSNRGVAHFRASPDKGIIESCVTSFNAIGNAKTDGCLTVVVAGGAMRFRQNCNFLILKPDADTQSKSGGKGIRTPDLLIANETLYQLSYTPKKGMTISRDNNISPANLLASTFEIMMALLLWPLHAGLLRSV